MTLGRPPEYKPEYCQMLIDHMAGGYSLESFAGKIDTCKKTLYNWQKQYPDFLHAANIGRDKCRQWWESIAINNIISESIPGVGSKSINAIVWKANMQCRFRDEWREEQRHQIETTESKPSIDLDKLPVELKLKVIEALGGQDGG